MLRLLVGRSALERGKSLAIVSLAGLVAVSLWQVSIGRAMAVRDQHDRENATSVAQQFATALTTYDYAHLDVQATRVAAISVPSVRQRVGIASQDLVLARASSLGTATGGLVSELTTDRAEVLVPTLQLVSGKYEVVTTPLKGLLDVRLSRSQGGWVVSDYLWLMVAGETP